MAAPLENWQNSYTVRYEGEHVDVTDQQVLGFAYDAWKSGLLANLRVTHPQYQRIYCNWRMMFAPKLHDPILNDVGPYLHVMPDWTRFVISKWEIRKKSTTPLDPKRKMWSKVDLTIYYTVYVPSGKLEDSPWQYPVIQKAQDSAAVLAGALAAYKMAHPPSPSGGRHASFEPAARLEEAQPDNPR